VGGLEVADRDPLPAVVPPDRVAAGGGPADQPREARQLEDRLGYRFRDRRLLREALTHSSVAAAGRRPPPTNERLEFLGDRVVGLAVAELLIRRYPHEPEGALTPRLSALVSEPALAEMARELELGGALKLARSEAEAGGRERPAILADAFEAVIGAVYRDGGWEAAAGIVWRVVEPRLETMAAPPRDAKSRLQEWTQSRGLGLPAYEVTETSGPAHAPTFQIAVSLADVAKVSATGGSKRAAEQAAAERLLARLTAEAEQP
jgi:ribonuclease-3